MNPSLQKLVEIAPPPGKPVAPGAPADWSRVESEIGTRLPQDFKDYIALYGAGQWGDFFGIMDPFYEWKHPDAQEDWVGWMTKRVGPLKDMRSEFPEEVAPFDLHPAPNGLLPIGYDDNGGTMCWQTTGAPDSWPIICLDEGLTKEYDMFEMSLTSFLAALLHGEVTPRTFPPDFFPIPQPAFRPYATE